MPLKRIKLFAAIGYLLLVPACTFAQATNDTLYLNVDQLFEQATRQHLQLAADRLKEQMAEERTRNSKTCTNFCTSKFC